MSLREASLFSPWSSTVFPTNRIRLRRSSNEYEGMHLFVDGQQIHSLLDFGHRFSYQAEAVNSWDMSRKEQVSNSEQTSLIDRKSGSQSNVKDHLSRLVTPPFRNRTGTRLFSNRLGMRRTRTWVYAGCYTTGSPTETYVITPINSSRRKLYTQFKRFPKTGKILTARQNGNTPNGAIRLDASGSTGMWELCHWNHFVTQPTPGSGERMNKHTAKRTNTRANELADWLTICRGNYTWPQNLRAGFFQL